MSLFILTGNMLQNERGLVDVILLIWGAVQSCAPPSVQASCQTFEILLV